MERGRVDVLPPKLESAPVFLQHFQLFPQDEEGFQQSQGHYYITWALQQGRSLWVTFQLVWAESWQFGPVWLKYDRSPLSTVAQDGISFYM